MVPSFRHENRIGSFPGKLDEPGRITCDQVGLTFPGKPPNRLAEPGQGADDARVVDIEPQDRPPTHP